MSEAPERSDAARRVLRRAGELATFTQTPGEITRPLASPALDAAMERVRGWMEQAGLATRRDALGNLAGRRETGAVVMGSHLDSVANAGRYDGILGVLVALEVAAATEGPLEVVAFADEEGLRFQSTFLGSRAYLGRLEPRELDLRDRAGVTLAAALGRDGAALTAALGGDGATLGRAPGPRTAPHDIRAYFEVHIEQGPVLESRDLPLGVVTAIAGQSRFNLAFQGRAAHAGTTPMPLRRDALAAAAELVLAAERAANDEPGLVATVGELGVPNAACNVVPGRVDATLDIRHQDDAIRHAAIEALRTQADAIGARRNVATTWETIADVPATPCTPALLERLGAAVAATGVEVFELPSGAGHDAVTMAGVTDVAMLFVRCAGGISHHPDEAVAEADVALAIEAATGFVRSLMETHV